MSRQYFSAYVGTDKRAKKKRFVILTVLLKNVFNFALSKKFVKDRVKKFSKLVEKSSNWLPSVYVHLSFLFFNSAAEI